MTTRFGATLPRSPRPLLASLLCQPGPPEARLFEDSGACVMAVPGRYGVSYLLLGAEAIAVADCGSVADVPRILEALRWLGREEREVRWVIPTHLHFDHMMGVDPLALRLGAQVTLGPTAAEHVLGGLRLRWPPRLLLLRATPTWPMQGLPMPPAADLRSAPRFGFPWADNHFQAKLAPPLSHQGELAGLPGWVTLATPGHSDDSICLYHEGSGWLIAGDTLRNFCGGEWNPLVTCATDYHHTRRLLGELDVRRVFPGHGPSFVPAGGLRAGVLTLPWWMP